MTMKESFQKLLEKNPGIALIPKDDIVNIGWHIFLNRIVTYAAIGNAS